MIFSKKSHEGYLMIDHRASPGLTEEFAKANGMDPAHCREGGFYETPTIGCAHCGAHVIKNPFRVRARGYCPKCDKYVCDYCDLARSHPDYVHRSIDDIVDLLKTGKWTLSGSISNPIFTPVSGDKTNG